MTATSSTLPTLPTVPTSPAATRARRAGWRDPRFAVGLGLVALCGLLGARLLAAADDKVPVWALSRDLPAGSVLAAGDLDEVLVGFATQADADRYVAATDVLPAGTTLARGLAHGELLPRSALAAQGAALVEVPLAVDPAAIPATAGVAAMVDVWVSLPESSGAGRAVLALDDVVVVARSSAEGGFGGAGHVQQLVVGLTPEQERQLPEALALLARGTVVVTTGPAR